MTDYSDQLLAGDALTAQQRQDFEGDPAPTLQGLLDQARRALPTTSSQALTLVVGFTRDAWPDGVREAAQDMLIDALSGNAESDAVDALLDLGAAVWPRLMDRVLAQDIPASLETVLPILSTIRPAETTAGLIELAKNRAAGAGQRKWALDALRLLARAPKPNDPLARTALVEVAAKDPAPELQAFAVRMLTEIGANEFLDELGAMISPNQELGLVLELLDYVQMTASRDALPYLRSLVNVRDAQARRQLAIVLHTIGTPDAVSILGMLLRYERENIVIREAVAALEGLGGGEAIEPLAGVAVNAMADAGLRRRAIVALGAIGGEQAAHSLVGMLDRLGDSSLETRVLETLMDMGQRHAAAREALIRAVIHSSDRVRRRAREHLAGGLTPEASQALAEEVVSTLIAGRRAPLDDDAARNVAELLRVLARQAGITTVPDGLCELALQADDLSPVYVLRDLVGAENLAVYFEPTLSPTADPRPPQEQINRAEDALMAVPSRRGIEVLVRYRIDRSRRDRRERLGLVATGEDSQDGTSEDLFRRLRESGVAIFEDTAKSRARGAYLVMLLMNGSSFLLTFVFTGLCLYFAFFAKPESTSEALQLMAGGGALLGGLLTVIQARLFAPVKAIQDSVANLAMVQMTFMGFISRLEQVRVVFQDLYLNSAFDVRNLRQTDAILQDTVADALAHMGQFIRKPGKEEAVPTKPATEPGGESEE